MKLRRAFTYVELMIVLTIISILAAIAVPNFLEAQVRAAVARSKAELAVLKMAVEAYRLENRAYPPNRVAGKPDGRDLLVLTTPVLYISRLPLDIFTLPEARGHRHPHPLAPAYYQYFNAIQIEPERGLGVLAPRDSPEQGSSQEPSSKPSRASNGSGSDGSDQSDQSDGSGASASAVHFRTYPEFSGYVAALMWGIGPGESLPRKPSAVATRIAPDATAHVLPYDPTNGTTSDGDIYQTLP